MWRPHPAKAAYTGYDAVQLLPVEPTIEYRREDTSTADHRPPQEVVMVAHMGGAPMTVNLGDWLQLDMAAWQVALTTPGLELGSQPEDAVRL